MGRLRYTGVRFRPKSFVSRFRATVRKFLYFQKRISKLGPGYFGCNERQSSCTRVRARPRQGCPTCEYTVQTKIFHKELQDELNVIKGGTRKGAKRWPLKLLLRLAVEAGSFSGRKDNDPKWPVMTSLMVSIYRDETAKIQAIDSFNLTAGYGDTPTKSIVVPKDVADEGDFD